MSSPTIPTPPGFERDQPALRCANCSAPLAADQRYCLNCGHRLSEPRVDFLDALGLQAPPPEPPPRASVWDQRAALITLAAIAAVVLALGVGIVIGRGNQTATTAQRATVITVPAASPATAAAPSTSSPTVASISEDWPAGTSGWTVELSSLDKSGAQAAAVAAAKSAASGKGASAVGVLDGDTHSGTPTGKYVIYSGQYSSQKQARAAQAKLKKSFPGALVLHVTPHRSASSSGGSGSSGSAAVSRLHKLSGSAYVQASKKLPSQIGTGGAAPPKDNKAPGAGGSATCIGC